MRWGSPAKYLGSDGVCHDYPWNLEESQDSFVTELGGTGINAGPSRTYTDDQGNEIPLPVSGDATCTGTLVTNMSLNQDARPDSPRGCD
jgi:hypothetical protein